MAEKIFDSARVDARDESLGNFDGHLKTMYQLCAVKPFAVALVRHKRWIPMKNHLSAINETV